MLKEDGDEIAGYRFEPVEGTAVLHGWGFWSDSVALLLAARAGELLSDLPPGSPLILCFEGLHPQRPAGEEALATLLGSAKRRRARVFVIAPNAITRLQLRRVAAAADVELAVAASLDEALAKSRTH